MIFSELYSAYYNTVAAIISHIIEGKTWDKELSELVSRYAFGESMLTVIPSLKSGKWQLVRHDMTTPIEHKPSMPLTTLQKRWLKAISLDPRVRLFGVAFPELDGIEPLFTPDDYFIYDKYSDSDPFEDEEYIRKFRTVLEAIHKNKCIQFKMPNRNGKLMHVICKPIRLEYSEKDDKFRIITKGRGWITTVNLARISSCSFYLGTTVRERYAKREERGTITVRINDERNALERFMLHFAHFEKQAERLDNSTYIVKIKYPKDDESELVIRILSFGPMAEVISPQSFRNLIIQKLIQQKSCGLN